MSKNRVLQPKDAANFRSALKLYETKQYKKALKTVDQILKKNSDHGETLALKGLVLYHMSKKEEGYEYIKKGLMKDLSSYVCWHIHGMYHRSEKNYDEATKCFVKALKFDPENQNVLRDLSLLQAQVHQWDALVISRKKMLTDKPGFRQNWTALAVAQYLTKDYSGAESTLSSFEKLLTEPLPKLDTENSEILMFKNLIIYESGDVERALSNLDEIKDIVLDKKGVLEARAKYLMELGRNKEAEREYRALLKRNPECLDYYNALETVLGIDESDIKLRTILYRSLQKKYPKSDAAKAIPLEFLSGEDFKAAVAEYLTNHLQRQVPSLFVMVKPLYDNADKIQAIEDFMLDYYESLASDDEQTNGNRNITAESALSGDQSVTNGKQTDTHPNLPPSLIWTLSFLGQHYSYLNKHDLALEYIDKALCLDPKMLELHMYKAKILKHCGDYSNAADCMVYARKLDTSDRFINTKAAKYLMRAGKMNEAIDTISLFTKNDSNGKGVQDLHDMQGIWFLLEQGDAYARAGNYGLALKRYHAVVNIFVQYKNDQFDFHFYCTRKGSMRQYLDMLRWGDSLFNSPLYSRAAESAINIYINLFDTRLRAERQGISESEVGLEGLDEAEKKKALKRAKKERAKELKKEYEEQEKSESKDPDMFGKKLVGTKEPIKDAFKLWSRLNTESYNTWQLGLELYLRDKDYPNAIQSLVRAMQLDAPAYWLKAGALRCRNAVEKESDSKNIVKSVEFIVLSTVAEDGNILDDDMNDWADKYLISDRDSQVAEDGDIYRLAAQEVLTWAKTKIEINEGISSIMDQIEGKLLGLVDIENLQLKDAIEGYELLKSWSSSKLEDYKSGMLKLWPHAIDFKN